jgi:hypothetical protein
VTVLDDDDRRALSGDRGPALQLAMELVLQAARILEAPRLIPVSFAHIDACFWNGAAHVDFAQFLLDHGATFAVETWTNNGVVSLANPEIRPEAEEPDMVQGAKRLMELYEAMGCKPTWTCAPYQLPRRPKKGADIVAGESNAVTFYNSVLGARTNKYGDYLDVACALIGKVPFAGLHTDEGRMASLAFSVAEIPDRLKQEDIFYHLLGTHVGHLAGRRVPVIDGLPSSATEDNLKALSAAAAAAGGVELWHGVGVTPEAPALETVYRGTERHSVSLADLAHARHALDKGGDGPIAMVALGTPHFSFTEFAALIPHLEGRQVAKGIILYISTSRFVRELVRQQGWLDILERAGATIVVDTCTYYSPAVRGCHGRVMTNAAKWAYYAPGMLGVEVSFGSLKECAEAAVRGEVWRDPDLWQRLAA